MFPQKEPSFHILQTTFLQLTSFLHRQKMTPPQDAAAQLLTGSRRNHITLVPIKKKLYTVPKIMLEKKIPLPTVPPDMIPTLFKIIKVFLFCFFNIIATNKKEIFFLFHDFQYFIIVLIHMF